MSFARALRHVFSPPWHLRRAFPQDVLDRIEAAVRESEIRHRAEVRFAVEGALEFLPVARGLTPRERALEVFSLLRVWDTEENSGVLIYVQLVDRDIEIVADRGVASQIAQDEWEAICHHMEVAFAAGRYEEGALTAIAAVTALLVRHFPAGSLNPDELPDKPVVL
jgi:uncharacterized membrane protein